MICPHCGKFIEEVKKKDDKVYHQFTFTFGRIAPSNLAILVGDGINEFWLPKSQLKYEGDYDLLKQNDTFEVGVSEWICKEKGLFEGTKEKDIPF